MPVPISSRAQNPKIPSALFLVDRDDTVQVEHVYGLMGTRGGGTARILFKDTKVPKKNVILGLNRGGEVFNRMMVPERPDHGIGGLGRGTRRAGGGHPIQHTSDGLRAEDHEVPSGEFPCC